MTAEDILRAVEALQWRNDRPAFERSLTLLDSLEPAAQQSAHALTLRGYARFRLDEDDDALAHFEQALESHDCTGRTAVLAHLRIALLHACHEQLAEAKAHTSQALLLCDSDDGADAAGLRPHVVFMHARVLLAGDTPEAAEPSLREAIVGFEAIGDLYRAAWAFHELAEQLFQMQRLAELDPSAERLLAMFATALSAVAALDDFERDCIWVAACRLAVFFANRGQGARARELLLLARHTCEFDGLRYAEALDDVAAAMRDHDMRFVAACYEEILRDDLDPEARAAIELTLADALIELGENERARFYCESALTAPESDPYLHALARISIATALMNEGRQAEAAYVLPLADELATIEDADLLMLRGRIEAVLWHLRGANRRGLELLAELLDRFEGEASPRQVVHSLASMASMAAQAELWDFADEALQQARNLLDTTPLGELEAGALHFSLGYVEMQRDDYVAAIEAFERARRHFERARHRNMWVLASVNMLVATSLLEDDDAVHRLADELEPIVDYHPAYAAAVDYQRAECFYRSGDVPLALRHYEQAAKNFAAAGRIISEAETLDTMAGVEHDLRRRMSHARKALQLVLALATFLDDEEQRLDLLARSRHIGARLAYLHLIRDDVASALTTVFEVKSGDFLRLLYERHGTTPELDDVLQNAAGSTTAPLSPFHPAMHMRPADARASHRVLEKYIELVRSHPHATPQLVQTRDVLARLGPDRVAIEYFLPAPTADHFLIFVAHAGRVDCIEQDWSPADAHRVQSVLERVCGTRGTGSRVHARSLARDLAHLHERFFAPLEDAYLSRPGVRHLTLAPGAGLVHIPFQACLTSDGTPLVHRFSLDFTITLGQLALDLAPRSPRPFESAAIWHPDDHTSDALPSATREADELHDLLTRHGIHTHHVTDWHAPAIRNADLIHYAGHTHPHGHSLALGTPDAPLGPLDLIDIPLERHPLVVLAACDTGAPHPFADEFTGLLRALFAAGASTIICTAWPAHDQGAHELMTHFYPELVSGLVSGSSPTDALTHASRELAGRADNLAHPFFWSNFRCYTAH